MIDISYLSSLASQGYKVIPAGLDKRPMVKWRGYYDGTMKYSFDALGDLFSRAQAVALLTGSCSNSVEIVDIDTKYDLTGELHLAFSREVKSRIPDFFKRGVCFVRTPSGGYHMIYRVDSKELSGNKKLASRPLTQSELESDPSGRSRVLIETRCNGGYALIYPTAGYEIISGDYLSLPLISADERDLIMEAAYVFNETVEIKAESRPRMDGSYNYHIAPWDDFNNRVSCEEVLISCGYKIVGHKGDDLLVLRPGQSTSYHSGYVHTDSNIFVCFSSSTPFEPGKGHTAYMVYTVLKHKGDPKSSAIELLRNGFGIKNEAQPQREILSAYNPSSNGVHKKESSDYNKVVDSLDSLHSQDDFISKKQVNKTIGKFSLSDEVQQIIQSKALDKDSILRHIGYKLEREYLSSVVGFPSEAKSYLDSIRRGTFVMGLTTGSTYLDQYFRYKQGNIVMIHGIANVGKSLFTWYLCLISSVLHNWRWILYVAENEYEHCVRTLIQFYCGKWISDVSESEYQHALEFVESHFLIIKNTSSYSASEICSLAEYLHFDEQYGPFNGLVIDPYNSLVTETKISEGLKKVHSSKHDLDYEVMSSFRTFCKRTSMSLFMNVHTGTEKARQVQQSGKAPNMYDVEGGGKFANRADDFITTHRNTKDNERGMITEMHVDKIKATETGGRPTAADGPVEFYLWYSKYRFVILEPSSSIVIDPMEIATGRGTGQYPKRLVMNNISDETPRKMYKPENPKDAIPEASFFDSKHEDLPF